MATEKKRILWVDDEIDLLRPHILFLEGKGYSVTPVANGEDAISMVSREKFDIVLLDEMMPGLGGLETLRAIKDIDAGVPVVMITKSEAEELMDEAIGQRIAHYLIKPVNPTQILTACKQVLESRRLVESQLTKEYVEEFRRIQLLRNMGLDWKEWVNLHVSLSSWDVRLDDAADTALKDSHADQRREANAEFGRFVEANYPRWLEGRDCPPLSPILFEKFVVPHLKKDKRVYLIVIDCMRLDQWLKMESALEPYFDISRDYYYSILPTATPYARNAIFSGLFPAEIAEQYPSYWRETAAEDLSRNKFEKDLMEAQLRRLGVSLNPAPRYVKVYNSDEANAVRRQITTYLSIPFVAFVFNFVDILAHGRSESEILQELAPDESAFRSLMRSWFGHSVLFDIMKAMSQQDAVVVLSTDHGSVLGKRAALVYGDRQTSSNLRYKFGKNLVCDETEALRVREPLKYGLPADILNKNYLFAKEDYYFVYPTKFHEYERQYRGSFQHGGISLEEMILPCVTLFPR
ncbi:MAG: response regulator [Candidatus Eiseniibacteriota bacterium]|nr:MAG: response regulator [Candidatus Eisenbacteria bacterium]